MIRRSNTASGAYLLRRAAKLAKSVVPTYGSKSEIVDGYLLRGRRAGDIRYAEVVDPPAWLVVVGTLKLDAPVDRADSLLLELALGRDTLMTPRGVEEVNPSTRLVVTRPQGTLKIGDATMPAFAHPTRTNDTAFSVPSVGVIRGLSRLYADQAYPVNAMAFVDRTARVQYEPLMLAPQLGRSVIELVEAQWVRTDTTSTAPLASLTVLVDDSLLRDSGALPFCIRIAPPPYDPNSAAGTDWAWAQAPWQDQVAERYTDDQGVDRVRLTVWSQVVVDMRSDFDKFGARGLWICTVDVDVAARVATVRSQAVYDQQADSNVLRRPQLVDQAYLYNAHLRVGGAMLDTGTAVVLDAFQVATDGGGTTVRRYMSVDLFWISRNGSLARRQTILDAFNVNTGPHDMRCPVGIATDGVEAVVFAFTTVYTNQPSNLDIIVVTENAAGVVYSEDVPFYPCLGVAPGSRFSTGQDDAQHWATVGAGGNQACYIGNGKYLFMVSSVVSLVGIAGGNVAAAVYDRATNTAAVVGVVDEEVRAVTTFLAMGKPDCVVQETPERKATIIATRGGQGQVSNEPGTEGGDTWISYDSGATWSRLSSYGSPAGTLYCGNTLQAR